MSLWFSFPACLASCHGHQISATVPFSCGVFGFQLPVSQLACRSSLNVIRVGGPSKSHDLVRLLAYWLKTYFRHFVYLLVQYTFWLHCDRTHQVHGTLRNHTGCVCVISLNMSYCWNIISFSGASKFTCVPSNGPQQRTTLLLLYSANQVPPYVPKWSHLSKIKI